MKKALPKVKSRMFTAQVVETSVTVNNNSPIQDYVPPGRSNSTYFWNGSWFQTFDNIICFELSKNVSTEKSKRSQVKLKKINQNILRENCRARFSYHVCINCYMRVSEESSSRRLVLCMWRWSQRLKGFYFFNFNEQKKA